MRRKVRLSDPMRKLPTDLLVRIAAVSSGMDHQAEAQFALKERRLRLLADHKAIDEAEVSLQANIVAAIRRRARLSKCRQAFGAYRAKPVPLPD